ncbi:hypothetical protein ABIF16_008144 [Bradyrhizobium elkanii]
MSENYPNDETWQKLTRKLLCAVQKAADMKWKQFCSELGIENWEAVRESSWEGRGYPSEDTRDRLLIFCERNPKFALDPYQKLRRLIDPVGAPEVASSFLSKLGIHAEDIKGSVTRHAGDFVFFVQDEDGKIIVCKSKLDRAIGDDGLPTFEMGRDVDGARRSVVGGYYSTEDQLFLTGHRQDHRDLRLMIFRVERPSTSPDEEEGEGREGAHASKKKLVREQQFYKGLVAGVSWIHSIFASRCVLIRERHARQLLAKKHRSKEWESLVGEKELSYIEKAFPEVANYLTTNQPSAPVHLPPTRMTHPSPDM